MNPILIKLRSILHRSFDRCFCQKSLGIDRLGDINGWHIKTDEIHADSIVYCAGVGHDISFELALVKRFGTTIHLMDPSPTGIATMALPESQEKEIVFYPLGLAGESGELEFGEPLNPEEGSFTVAAKNTKRVKFHCTSIGDFMRKMGHDHVDLLKMDIEGCEYGVLDSILDQGLSVRMICCEFHHFLPGYTRLMTLRHVLKLRQRGYSLIHKYHHDYTFWADKNQQQKV